MEKNKHIKERMVGKRRAAAYAMGIFTVVIWGTTFISTKVLLEAFSPIDVLIIRFVIGYLGLAVLKPHPMKWQGFACEIWYFLAGLSGITIYFLCENIALTITTASNVGIIVSLAPMITAFLAFFFLKEEKLNKNFFLGFVVAMAGIILIHYSGRTQMHLNPAGDVLAVGAAAVWAVYSIILKGRLDMKKDVIASTRRILFYGLITMIPCGFILGFDISALGKMIDGVYLPNFLYLGLGASTICYITWNWIIEELGALKASVYIYVIPVITIIASALILKETITRIIAVGAVLTILGLLLSERK